MNKTSFQERILNSSFAFLPLIPAASILFKRIGKWWSQSLSKQEIVASMVKPDMWSVENQLLAYVSLAVIGFVATNHLIPNIKVCENCVMWNATQPTLFIFVLLLNPSPLFPVASNDSSIKIIGVHTSKGLVWKRSWEARHKHRKCRYVSLKS